MYTDVSSTASLTVEAAWDDIGAAVSETDAALAAWLDRAHRVGLSEFRAAVHLSRADDDELRINDLAVRLGLNQSSTTRLVLRLEAKGLVCRDTCPDDRRGVYAVLTDAGRELVAQASAPYADLVRARLADRPGLKHSLAVISEITA